MKKKVAFLGVFLALALIFSYIETWIPNVFGVPGIKLGLANIVIIILLFRFGTKEAYGISVARSDSGGISVWKSGQHFIWTGGSYA